MIKIFEYLADTKNKKSVSSRLRKKRFEKFLKSFDFNKSTKVLDVGGTEDIWIGTGLEENVTLLNLSFSSNIKPFTYIIGDACNMFMFSDKQFDIVFSNSVIEHVGNFERQTLFAKEVERVGKGYWVQTPYKYFPVEPHFLFPLFQFLPRKIKIIIGKNWEYSHIKKQNEDVIEAINTIRLLTIKEITQIFSNAKIFREKFFGITKSIIVYKK